MAETQPSAVQLQRQRSLKIWSLRTGWDALYRDAYDYVLPNRRPGGNGALKSAANYIFDMTGPNSAIHCAGEIQRQIIPAATPFNIEAGPLLANRLPGDQLKVLNRELQTTSAFVYPFFKTGDFDTAVHEMCTDLTIGTGALLPLRGPSIEDPLRFIAIPQDEIAIGQDAWGRIDFVSWKRANLGNEAIIGAWPEGKFTQEFREKAKKRPYDETTVYQDFFRLKDGRWRFVAYFETDGDEFIVSEDYRTQPICVARFYRVPGESYGRGPVLFALPTIRTVNKAQELALKAAAIQLLGIWGFRAGGTFNPDTVRVGPGEFWPMHSTGGILGPDVMRLDPSAGRIDVARMVIGSGQSQIREALLDTRIFDDGGTPRSASEIAATMRQNASVHVGAYGRLIRETMPVIVPRAMEILNEWKLLPQLMSFNELLTTVTVASPMLAAMKADQLEATARYFELAVSVSQAPPSIDAHLSRQRLLAHARQALNVPADMEPTPDEVAASQDQTSQEQLTGLVGEMATRAAPQLAQGLMAPEAA